MGKEAQRRQNAQKHGAIDAKAMVAAVPYLARLLTDEQLSQFQSILDAAVLNPVYKEAFEKAYNDSVTARSGPLVLHDPAKKRKAYRILQRTVRVHKNDHYIRLNYHKMLTAGALSPQTNNPDEADYLARVREVLDSKGIWLQLKQPWDRGTDPRVWEFAFKLGAGGDVIKTDDAMIDREELLQTTMLGSGYYNAVLTGPVQTKIKRMIKRLGNEQDNGWSTHMDMIKDRNDAAFGVAKVSEILGGADMPDIGIWNRPHKLKMKAYDANASGDVITAQVYLVAAATAIENNSLRLRDYNERIIGGAENAVKVLKVAKAAGQVAEVGLLLTGAGVGVKALRAGGSKAMSKKVRDEATEKLVRDYAKKNGISEAELASVRYVKQSGGGTTLGNIKGGHSAGHGTGFGSWP